MISNDVPGLYPGVLLPIGPSHPDGAIPGFQQRFQSLFADAELTYGPRDPTWNLLGLEIVPAGVLPAIKTLPAAGRNCALRLSLDSAESIDLLDWQLSHEIVHLLGPNFITEITMFEEAVASYNQHRIRLGLYGIDAGFNELRYQAAFNLVRPWLDGFPEGVRHVRAAMGGSLSPASPDLLRSAFPGMPETVSRALAERFYV